MTETADQRAAILTGGCQCGAVRYALYAPPEDVHICHCRMCQRAVGGPFAALAPVKVTDFAWTRGAPPAFASSSVAERHFCPACGTPLTFHYVDSDWIDVTLGSLDDPNAAAPAAQYGTEARLDWFETLPSLPGMATMLSAERQSAIVNFQHPDHDTGNDWRPPRQAGDAL